MLHLIPTSLHRVAYRVAHGLRKRWWRLRKPRLIGCRMLVFDDQDRVLLVRHSYGSGQWMPPGGGVGKGEKPLIAAGRELFEETGCILLGAHEFALVEEPLHGAINQVHVVVGRTLNQPVPDGREVIEAGFFGTLPPEMTPNFAAVLPGLITAAKAVLQRE